MNDSPSRPANEDGKVGIAMGWAASCGGCDVSLLDIEEPLLEVAEIATFAYWPVAMDMKRDEFLAREPQSVDFGLYNGSVRTTEQEEDAHAFREKCRVLVAYGSCACFGGIPGLANFHDADSVQETAYSTTPSTENPDGVRPAARVPVEGHEHELTLPDLFDTVKSLPQVVDVDILLPGCPPPTERILDLVAAVKQYAATGDVPPKGTVIASDKALCDECPRGATREGGRLEKIVRPHESDLDPTRCFMDQGVLCMGIATRGGCGATCIAANMPCRGCFGPTADMLDPAAEALSAIGSIAGAATENDQPEHLWKKAVRSIVDPAGTFYRYTLPSGFLPRAVTDKPDAGAPNGGK